MNIQMLLEVNGHIHQLREDARMQQLREDEQTDVLEIFPVQLLFGKVNIVLKIYLVTKLFLEGVDSTLAVV